MGARRAQDLIEANGLIEFLRPHNIGTYLEIGARHGWTFYLVGKLLKPAHMLAVDLPGVAPWGDERSEVVLKKVSGALAGDVATRQLLFQGSQSSLTMMRVRDELLAGAKVDALFIDADHKYTGVKSDWELYSPLVRDGGYVVFHDINATRSKTKTKDKVIEVDQLWNELKPQYEHWEIINDGSGMGLGILRI